MLNARGAIVLACFALAAAVLVGSKIGADTERAKWDRWTYAHVAFETKGDAK